MNYDPDEDSSEQPGRWWQTDNFWETCQQISDAVNDYVNGSHAH